jgi:hypothetical protein
MRSIALGLAALAALWAHTASAIVHVGDVAPPFTKNELISTPTPHAGGTLSLSDYAGKVLVLHLMGFN